MTASREAAEAALSPEASGPCDREERRAQPLPGWEAGLSRPVCEHLSKLLVLGLLKS